MRKLLLLVSFVLIATTSFAGGGRESDSGTVHVNPPGRLPVVDRMITQTAFIPSIGFIDDMNTNASVVALEDATNVHIDWIESSKVDARNKLSILLASGDYPDMIQGASGAGISPQELYLYGEQGVFLGLDGLIDREGYWIMELFDAEPFVRSAIRSADGNTYGLPAVFTDDYHMTMRQKLWVNKTWLDNLGLALPRTLSEFYSMLVAFKTKDANGNGDPNDEIPITGAKRHLEDAAMWIMNAFIVAGGQDDSGDALLNGYEFIEDGQVIFNANTPEFHDGLRFIHKLYVEGLMDVAALTQDRDQIKPLVDGGNASRIGAVASHHPGNVASIGDSPDARFHQYVALPPIQGPNGNQSTPWLIDGVVIPGQLVLTSADRHPDVSMRWADYMYSLQFGQQEKGIEGVHWRHVDPGEGLIGLNGQPAKYQYLKVLTQDDDAQINLGPVWTRDLKNEFAKSQGFSYEELLYDATNLYAPYKVARYPYATASIAAADIDEFTDLRRTIHTFVGESVDRFIIGDLDLDAGWDEYVRQLEQIGLGRYLEILRNAYRPE